MYVCIVHVPTILSICIAHAFASLFSFLVSNSLPHRASTTVQAASSSSFSTPSFPLPPHCQVRAVNSTNRWDSSSTATTFHFSLERDEDTRKEEEKEARKKQASLVYPLLLLLLLKLVLQYSTILLQVESTIFLCCFFCPAIPFFFFFFFHAKDFGLRCCLGGGERGREGGREGERKRWQSLETEGGGRTKEEGGSRMPLFLYWRLQE